MGLDADKRGDRLPLPAVLPAVLLLLVVLLAVVTTRLRPEAPGGDARIEVAGRIRAASVSVAAPVVPLPAATVGAASSPATGQPRVAGVVASTAVGPGDSVRAGDEIARLDTRVLEIRVRSMEAAAREASAQAAAVSTRIEELSDKRAELKDKRAEVVDALERIGDARAELQGQLEQARAAREQMRMIGRAAPRTAVPGRVPQAGAARPPDFDAIVAKLTAALAELDRREAQARAGLAKIDSARAKAAEADAALRDARELARVGAEARLVGVEFAKALLAMATLRSPVDGVVLTAAKRGEAVMANAPVVTLRPAGEPVVDAYLTVGERDRVRTGSRATVRVDSLPGRSFPARVTRVSEDYEFIPTTFPTSVVHLSRGFRVTLVVEQGVLPAGTPADVTIEPGTPGRG